MRFARSGGRVRHFDGWLRRGRAIGRAPGVVVRWEGPWLIDNTTYYCSVSIVAGFCGHRPSR